MHPNDMDFKVYAAGDVGGFTNEYFNERLQITTSHSIESSIPGKSLKWIVMETNTKRLWDLFVSVLQPSTVNLVMIG